jgi:flagellar biosynthesis protein FlhB
VAEKTEEPTPKRLRDARRQGNIAFSQEVPAAAGFLVGTLALGLWASRMSAEFRALYVSSVSAFAQADGPALLSAWAEPLRQAGVAFLWMALPVIAAIALASVGLATAQAGFHLAAAKLKPSLGKLNPGPQLKKWFSPGGVFDLGKSVVKLAVALLLGWAVLSASFTSLLALHRASLPAFYTVLFEVARTFVLYAGLAFAALAALDYFVQYRKWRKGLMMSREEVTREYKEQEGDPLIKGQRKALHQELANQAIVQETRLADAVVVNPTHLAVAVRYDRETMNAPRVTAKGGGDLARQMLAEARRHEVPVVRDVPLAHALFAVEMGRQVPREMYEVVAEVLLFASRLRQEGVGAADFERSS